LEQQQRFNKKKEGKEEEGVGRWEEFKAPSPSLAHLEFA
jgi:hypothetical protein